MKSPRNGLVQANKSKLARWGGRVAVLAALAALAVVPSACGSSSSGSTTTTTAQSGY
jgi:hypothetical protein